jgi:6-pyruvoyltetrahydropterin/6-carboxytetrahydropterin synthase
LVRPDGSKEPLHKHDWEVTAKVCSDKLDDMGLVMDFRQFKAMIDEITEGFGSGRLDSIDYFKRHNPSAENVAKYIYGKLEPKMPKGVKLRSIRVVEELGCSAKFSK